MERRRKARNRDVRDLQDVPPIRKLEKAVVRACDIVPTPDLDAGLRSSPRVTRAEMNPIRAGERLDRIEERDEAARWSGRASPVEQDSIGGKMDGGSSTDRSRCWRRIERGANEAGSVRAWAATACRWMGVACINVCRYLV